MKPTDGAFALPFSDSSERIVLGLLLLQSEDAVSLLGRITPEHFHNKDHVKIFRAFLSAKKRNGGKTPDICMVSEALKSLDENFDLSYAASLVDGLPRTLRVEEHFEALDDMRRRREIISLGSGVLVGVLRDGGGVPLEESAFALISGIQGIMSGASDRGARPASEIVVECIEEIEAASKGGGRRGASFGIGLLDEMTGGLSRGELIVVAARPSMGKSSFALGVSLAASEKAPACVFSLEDSARNIGVRLISILGGVPGFKAFRASGLSREDWVKIASAQSKAASKTGLLIDDYANSIPQICNRAEALRAKHGQISLIVVDYLQLIAASGQHRIDNRAAEVGAYSSALKRLAIKIDAPVLCVSQLNRLPEHRTDGRPRLADLRDSGAIEQDADVVLLLSRTDNDDGVVRIDVAKNRNGPTGTVEAAFLREIFSFRNLYNGE